MASEFDLIDRVARRMTDAEPRGDFRVRVIANLPSARRQSWWHVVVLAGGGVAAGMLIMTAFSVWSNRTHAPVQSSAHVERANATRGGTPVRRDGPVTPISTGRPLSFGPAGPGGPAEPVGSRGPQGPAGSFDGAFPLLSISPIQPSELSIAPIVVGPLVTGQIALPPIVK